MNALVAHEFCQKIREWITHYNLQRCIFASSSDTDVRTAWQAMILETRGYK